MLGDAAGPDPDESSRQTQPESNVLQSPIRLALKARAMIMFSGESGAPISTGIKEDAATCKEPTYGLCQHAMDVIFNDLDGALFDQFAAHRPCGILDRYEAVGMLIGDALGLPLMPRRPQGLAVGNKARKRLRP